MKLPVKRYSKNSAIVILPKKEFSTCEYVYVYPEECVSDSERLKRIEERLNADV